MADNIFIRSATAKLEREKKRSKNARSILTSQCENIFMNSTSSSPHSHTNIFTNLPSSPIDIIPTIETDNNSSKSETIWKQFNHTSIENKKDISNEELRPGWIRISSTLPHRPCANNHSSIEINPPINGFEQLAHHSFISTQSHIQSILFNPYNENASTIKDHCIELFPGQHNPIFSTSKDTFGRNYDDYDYLFADEWTDFVDDDSENENIQSDSNSELSDEFSEDE